MKQVRGVSDHHHNQIFLNYETKSMSGTDLKKWPTPKTQQQIILVKRTGNTATQNERHESENMFPTFFFHFLLRDLKRECTLGPSHIENMWRLMKNKKFFVFFGKKKCNFRFPRPGTSDVIRCVNFDCFTLSQCTSYKVSTH